VDATLVTQLKADLASLRDQEEVLRTQFRPQALSLLTAGQKTKLAALEQALSLMGVAHQAAGLNLLETPQGTGPRLDLIGRGGSQMMRLLRQ
jgi:hypothetical protein